MRSPTAADLVAGWGVQADFAGLSHDADEKLSSEQPELVALLEQKLKGLK